MHSIKERSTTFRILLFCSHKLHCFTSSESQRHISTESIERSQKGLCRLCAFAIAGWTNNAQWMRCDPFSVPDWFSQTCVLAPNRCDDGNSWTQRLIDIDGIWLAPGHVVELFWLRVEGVNAARFSWIFLRMPLHGEKNKTKKNMLYRLQMSTINSKWYLLKVSNLLHPPFIIKQSIDINCRILEHCLKTGVCSSSCRQRWQKYCSHPSWTLGANLAPCL